jgi:uncharacterized protein YeaO (DUF488 family)
VAGEVRVGRIGDAFAPGTTRVLVDRLWPRGVRREGAPWDVWLPRVAPSAALRAWYHAHPEEFETFSRRYRDELEAPGGEAQAALRQLAGLAREGPVALVTARREVDRSHAAVLRDVLTSPAPAGSDDSL